MRRRLELAAAARRFASERLGLPNNESYLHYADLKRPYVVWNVFAAPALSLNLHRSCFLFVGCLEYRGYYAEAAARRFAATLRLRGYDVYVGGVSAYSTLGWFDDPLLNTMLRWSDAELVKTIFHELAHQQFYVNGDSTFNESFATAVANYGLAAWRAEHPVADDTTHDDELVALLQRHRARLVQLYATAATDADKIAGKRDIFADLRRDYQALRSTWGAAPKYDAWMATDLNNAKLGSIATYHAYTQAFTVILRCVNGDLPRFYAAVREIAKRPEGARRQALEAAAVAEGCPETAVTSM